MMSSEIERLDEAISILLRIFAINERRYPDARGSIAFNHLDFETLARLSRQSGTSAKMLASELGISLTTMQSAIERLSGRKLVQRDSTALKGRAVALTLTDQGRKVSHAIHSQNLANCRAMLDCLAPDRRERFLADLETIASGLEASTISVPPPIATK